MKNLKLIQFGTIPLEYYKGILIHDREGLHGQVMELIKKYLPPPASVLDMGAGEGAFSLRLIDHGYNVDACDVDTKQFKTKNIAITFIDLHQNFTNNFQKKYDGLIALEVIEHLYNPWQFIQQCVTLVKPGGIIVLTTPNVTSFLSRYVFLRSGVFEHFLDDESLKYGHINPLTGKELEIIFQKNELEIIYKGSGGTLPLVHFPNWRIISKFTLWRNIMLPFFYLFMKGDKHGWCLIYIVRVKK
ncbi:MAG: class I SAM-dependent methyltransferase [Planctomycetes bacterium]|nr:class I SAM-dependent methyltransferase [Planctomycetota bacterium]